MPHQVGFAVFGVPVEFALFAATLPGVAIFSRRTLTVAVSGLVAIVAYKLVLGGFHSGVGLTGFGQHMLDEWVSLANLALLLTAFTILSRHFEQSNLPDLAPNILPGGWTGGLVLLALVFVVSGVLDNIAGALIGATIARHVYQGKVHVGYLVAIVGAANAGGAGSVIGDTTTTMMWIAGHSPLDVADAYVGALACWTVFAVPASLAQQKHQPILSHDVGGIRADWARVLIVAFILVSTISANVLTQIYSPHVQNLMPVLGVAAWVAILLAALTRKTDWSGLPEASKGAVFLLALVLCASLMPVEALPSASPLSTFGLGFISAIFDNIPLTALALKQGGYDWGVLAYAVGFGGSMVWFGSSAGVAVSNLFPEAKSVVAWVRAAWWLPPAYVIGFMVMLGTVGWRPN